MDQWQVELIERVTRIEANQEYIKSNVNNLPQSDQYKRELKEMHKEIDELKEFKTEIKEKIAYVGGVIIMIGLFVPYAIKWVFDHLSWKSL